MQPIIQTLLDVDVYKLTMLQFILHRYARLPVSFSFTNRTTDVLLAEWIDIEALKTELEHARSLQFNEDEKRYISDITVDNTSIFTDSEFQAYLTDFALPPYDLDVVHGQIKLEFTGAWADVTLWETIALAIINELYCREQIKRTDTTTLRHTEQTGLERLRKKIQRLKTRSDITFIEFGTRRRFSRAWQEKIVETLKENLPGQFIGTSNVSLAQRYDVQPVGTMAHELFMVLTAHIHATDGRHEAIRNAHSLIIDEWWAEYHHPLSIALTDTFGTDFCFDTMTKPHARQWKGFRQDSGNPLDFVDKTLQFYNIRGIDPTEKMIVFSDGLTIDTIIEIADYVNRRIKIAFGWGSNLTNDLGLKPLSLVVKPQEASGKPTVKLSDNLSKAMGTTQAIEFYKSIFGYTSDYNERCEY